MTKTYRRKRNSDTWHFCANCRHWPTSDYESSKKNLSRARCVTSVKPNARTETVSRQCGGQEYGSRQRSRLLDLDLPD